MATTTRSNKQKNGSSPNGNGATARASRLTKAKTERRQKTSDATVEERATELLQEIRNAIYKAFKVKLQTRDKRIATKVGHATKEKLGLDIAAQVRKAGKQMNWEKWNNQVFPKLFGRPDALKYDVEVIALCMAMLYDSFELDVDRAIKGLVEFNQESLRKRNEYKKENDTIDEDEDEDEDEFDDEENEEEEEDEDEDELLDLEESESEDSELDEDEEDNEDEEEDLE